jgi:hypothetical protein
MIGIFVALALAGYPERPCAIARRFPQSKSRRRRHDQYRGGRRLGGGACRAMAMMG